MVELFIFDILPIVEDSNIIETMHVILVHVWFSCFMYYHGMENFMHSTSSISQIYTCFIIFSFVHHNLVLFIFLISNLNSKSVSPAGPVIDSRTNHLLEDNAKIFHEIAVNLENNEVYIIRSFWL